MPIQGTVHVVDDDPAIRNTLTASSELRGLTINNYASAEALLNSCDENQIGYLVLVIRMPGANGLEYNQSSPKKTRTCHYSL